MQPRTGTGFIGMIRTYAALAAGFIIALLGGLAFLVVSGRGEEDPFATCRSTNIAGGAGQIGGPFSLVDGQGETVTEKTVLTKPSLVYFGYTFCPDVCPFDMVRNAEAVDLLEEKGKEVTPVFITVDPDRDTPAVVGEWSSAMHPRAIGLTGSQEQIHTAAQAYKVYYHVPEHAAGDESYLVDHSTFTYLMLPGYGFVDLIRRDQTPEQVAETAACFIDHM